MAEPRTSWQKIGLTPGKAALIGGLAVVLVGVVYIQFIADGSQDVAVTLPEASPPRAAAPTVSQPAAMAADDSSDVMATQPALAAAFDQTQWKSPPLESIVSHDPFALPMEFPRPAVSESQLSVDSATGLAASDANQLTEAIEQLQMELEALQQRGVHVIVRGRDRYVAMIGDRMINVGDEINGFTVTAIEADGVRVERKVD